MTESDKQTITYTAQLPERIEGEILLPLKSMGVLSLTSTELEFHSRNSVCDQMGETHMEDSTSLPGNFISQETKSSTSKYWNSTSELSRSFTL